MKTPPLEKIEQEIVCNYLDAKKIIYFSVPNAQITLQSLPKARQYSVLKTYKKQGVQPGVPDLIILGKINNPKMIAIELKRDKKHKKHCTCVSEDQKTWLELMSKLGWSTYICHGHNEVIEVLKKHNL